MASDVELVQKPKFSKKYKLANCCKISKNDYSKYGAYNSENIEVYFLDPTIDYKKAQNGALKRLIDLIYKSKHRIYFAIYGISNWDIINAVLDKYSAKLDIKWVTDVNKFGKNNYSRTVFLQDKLPFFRTDETDEILKFKNKQEVEHMKCLITEKYVVTGSLNWTSRAQFYNDENSLIMKNPQIALAYKSIF